MTCAPTVVVGGGGLCGVVQVATPGPQGPPGPAGSSTYTTPVQVANLPVGSAGARAVVTDSTSSVFYAAVTGSGTITVPVFWDGSVWRIG